MYIAMNGVTKQFGNKVVLFDISLEVAQGDLLALLGPSGCGKTTLLNALAGLLDIDGGSITIDGTLYSAKGYTLAPERRKIGMVFQDFALWPHMTVFDNIAFGLKVQKLPRRQIQTRVAEVLHIVRMTGFEQRFPHQLSGGQKQRVAIARALAPQPAVLLMDEPLSSLDAKLREEMRWQLLEIVRKTGVTTVYVTHDQVEALTMADHIVLLNQGRVEQEGSPEQLYNAPQTEFCASFIGASNLLPCRIVNHMGTWAKVDIDGFSAVATVADETLSQDAVFMVRPSDVTLLTEARASGQSGTAAKAVIEQRAFQGNTWQYRLRLLDYTRITLEVWDPVPRNLGETVELWVDCQRARLIHPAPADQLDGMARHPVSSGL